jgi:replicative DNA helicase
VLIEVQVISHIMNSTKGDTFIQQYQVQADYFHTYDEEATYIIKHLGKHKKIPDMISFLQKFDDFEIIPVSETESYLISELLSNHSYHIMMEEMQRIAPLVADNPEHAFQELKNLVIDLEAISFNKFNSTSIFDEEFIEVAKTEYNKRKELKGLSGISTGIDELDSSLYGWQDIEELVLILGRPNEGKSWLLVYFLVEAFRQHKKVLMYSGEMSKVVMFARIVTFLNHIGNKEIMTGADSIEKTYMDFLEYCKTYETEFIIIEPCDLENKRLSADVLEQYIKKHKPDIIGIDQLSLMSDYRYKKGNSTRDAYANITADLFYLSKEYHVPILLAVQANRNNMVDKRTSQNPPELHHIAEADAVGQNASKAISIKNLSNTEMELDKPNLLLKIVKNRFGEKDVLLGFDWRINEGKITRKTIVNTSSTEQGDEYEGGENPF